jgi:hypothetical protein
MSSTAAERIATRQRWDDAMARSRRLCTCSFRLLAVSKQTRVLAKRTRGESSTRRAERDDARTDVGVEAEVESEVQSFVVNGFVDCRPAHAHYLKGRLVCSAEVAERAEVVVAMGETFDRATAAPRSWPAWTTRPPPRC